MKAVKRPLAVGGVRRVYNRWQAVWNGGGRGCTKCFATRKQAAAKARLETLREMCYLVPPPGLTFDKTTHRYFCRPPRYARKFGVTQVFSARDRLQAYDLCDRWLSRALREAKDAIR